MQEQMLRTTPDSHRAPALITSVQPRARHARPEMTSPTSRADGSVETWGPQVQQLLLASLTMVSTSDFSGPGGIQARALLRQQLYQIADIVGQPTFGGWSVVWQPPTSSTISPRKLEVLHSLWHLLDPALTRQRLNLRENTLHQHTSDLIRHFGVTNWPQAVRAAQWLGLLPRGVPDWHRPGPDLALL